MQADRQTDVDIDQHLAGFSTVGPDKDSGPGTTNKTVSCLAMHRLLCWPSLHCIVGFESETGEQWKFLTKASLLAVWNASSLALANARMSQIAGLWQFLVFPGCQVFTFFRFHILPRFHILSDFHILPSFTFCQVFKFCQVLELLVVKECAAHKSMNHNMRRSVHLFHHTFWQNNEEIRGKKSGI